NLGSDQTDTFVLSMSFNPGSLTSSQLTSGAFGIASVDANGNWTNTVNNNFGASGKSFVAGPWKSSYALGTYGVDTSTNTAWAVVNHNSYFAVVNGI
ncbi:MAG: metallophosphoesterase, partial [Dissulfurispiraceae bacterium]